MNESPLNPSEPLETSAEALADAHARALCYVRSIGTRQVAPTEEARRALSAFDEPFPDDGAAPADVVRLLDERGSPATVATSGGRYFGYVVGGVLPAALGASTLAAAWDQVAGLEVMSPVGAKLEAVASNWLVDALRLPTESGVGFVSGATMANLSGLAAARHALYERAGWDVEAHGLYGAPPIEVVVGGEVHISIKKALGLLGFGRERVTSVPVDGQGRMRADAFPELTGPAIVCLQAGNVNTGAFDPFEDIVPQARASDAWIHVDGAFGLWAAACPTRAHLVRGAEDADSWAVDAHKWLNVPYDSGLVIVRHPIQLHEAMRQRAAYLATDRPAEPSEGTPQMSRRARGIEVWAALRSLGRSGLADLVERCCRYASRFADGLAAAGHTVLNDVELNQVLVSFGSDERTGRVIDEIQREGVAWCGGTTWRGRAAMRISVSSWATTDDDVEQCLGAMLAAAERA